MPVSREDMVKTLKSCDFNGNMRFLRLVYCLGHFTVEELRALMEQIFEQAPRVSELWLYGNEIGDTKAVIVANMLPRFGHLKQLFLNENLIGDTGAAKIAEALPSQLEVLSLNFNKIGDVGATKIAAILPKLRQLKTLFLNSNQVGVPGATELAVVLPGLSGQLRELYLDQDPRIIEWNDLGFEIPSKVIAGAKKMFARDGAWNWAHFGPKLRKLDAKGTLKLGKGKHLQAQSKKEGLQKVAQRAVEPQTRGKGESSRSEDQRAEEEEDDDDSPVVPVRKKLKVEDKIAAQLLDEEQRAAARREAILSQLCDVLHNREFSGSYIQFATAPISRKPGTRTLSTAGGEKKTPRAQSQVNSRSEPFLPQTQAEAAHNRPYRKPKPAPSKPQEASAPDKLKHSSSAKQPVQAETALSPRRSVRERSSVSYDEDQWCISTSPVLDPEVLATRKLRKSREFDDLPTLELRKSREFDDLSTLEQQKKQKQHAVIAAKAGRQEGWIQGWAEGQAESGTESGRESQNKRQKNLRGGGKHVLGGGGGEEKKTQSLRTPPGRQTSESLSRALGVGRERARGEVLRSDESEDEELQHREAAQTARSEASVASRTPQELPSKPVSVEIPDQYHCPLTLEVMEDPVVAKDGHSYERRAIEGWLEKHTTSPMTNEALFSADLFPNHSLKSLILEWKESTKGRGQ